MRYAHHVDEHLVEIVVARVGKAFFILIVLNILGT
jgi:hypothetical protein